MQITKGLPLDKIKQVEIHENNEPLVDIVESEKIKLGNGNFLIPKLRKSVFDLLIRASLSLPENHKLYVDTAYRPYSMQKKMWRNRLLQMAINKPFKMIFSNTEWIKECSRYTAPPGGSSHQCGAALDVTIINENNVPLDMGSTMSDFGSIVHTFSDEVNEDQKQNRKFLFDIMTDAGFANYPLEWWHYSYGDRMWAAYTERPQALYGPIN